MVWVWEGFGVSRVGFILALPISPPARELGAIRIKLTTHTGARDRFVVCVNFSLFH